VLPLDALGGKRARADWAGELARLCASKGYTLAKSSEKGAEAEEDGAAERKREQDDAAFHHARALRNGKGQSRGGNV
jgi:hypothetical protein